MTKHIDTLDVQLSLRGGVKDLIKDKLYPSSDEAGVYKLSPAYLPVAFRYQCRGYYLIVKLQHEFIEGIETVEELQEKVFQVVTDFFHITTDDIVKYKVVKTPTSKIRVRCKSGKDIIGKFERKLLQDVVEINRIEYCNNNRQKSTDEKLAAEDIFRIIADTSNGMTKALWKYPNRTNCTYSTERNNHVSITCYFKEYERLEDGDIAGAEKYKACLRTEVKVKNAHLDYKRNLERNARDKTLANYFNEEVAQEYFTKYIEPIFYTDPYYYRLDIAKDIIQNYQLEKKQDGKKQKENQEDKQEDKQEEQLQIQQFMKDRLCKFLTEINQFGITAVKEKYSAETFDNYSNTIRELGISILCFSPVINGRELTIEKMENFTLFKNSIEEDI